MITELILIACATIVCDLLLIHAKVTETKKKM